MIIFRDTQTDRHFIIIYLSSLSPPPSQGETKSAVATSYESGIKELSQEFRNRLQEEMTQVDMNRLCLPARARAIITMLLLLSSNSPSLPHCDHHDHQGRTTLIVITIVVVVINLILIVIIIINVQREEAEKQLERQNNAKRLMEQNIAELTEDTAEKQVMMMMDMIEMMKSMMESM